MSRVYGPRRERKVARLLERDGNRCHWCHAEFRDELAPTLEHLIPQHNGGTSDDENLVLACEPCNTERHHYVRCAGCGHRIRRGGVVYQLDTWHVDCRRKLSVA